MDWTSWPSCTTTELRASAGIDGALMQERRIGSGAMGVACSCGIEAWGRCTRCGLPMCGQHTYHPRSLFPGEGRICTDCAWIDSEKYRKLSEAQQAALSAWRELDANTRDRTHLLEQLAGEFLRAALEGGVIAPNWRKWPARGWVLATSSDQGSSSRIPEIITTVRLVVTTKGLLINPAYRGDCPPSGISLLEVADTMKGYGWQVASNRAEDLLGADYRQLQSDYEEAKRHEDSVRGAVIGRAVTSNVTERCLACFSIKAYCTCDKGHSFT